MTFPNDDENRRSFLQTGRLKVLYKFAVASLVENRLNNCYDSKELEPENGLTFSLQCKKLSTKDCSDTSCNGSMPLDRYWRRDLTCNQHTGLFLM